MTAIAWIAIGVALAPVVYVVATFNRLVAYRNEAAKAWSQIDVQLKRRHDLVPKLVEAVKGIMGFEKELLEEVASARASAQAGATASSGPASRAPAEGRLSAFVAEVLATWERYPELKSNRNALDLQDQLEAAENRIAYTRAHYNDVTANYNTLVERLPSCIVALVFGFRKREFFRAPGDEKHAPAASMG